MSAGGNPAPRLERRGTVARPDAPPFKVGCAHGRAQEVLS